MQAGGRLPFECEHSPSQRTDHASIMDASKDAFMYISIHVHILSCTYPFMYISVHASAVEEFGVS